MALTQPINKDAFEGPITSEELVSYCARVSNPSNQNNFNTSGKLLKYLVKNKHWSPFEMVSVTFEIETTRDIGRQILRHRSFSFQEFSQRYAEVSEDWFIKREARLQDAKNRQKSVDTDTNSSTSNLFEQLQHQHILDSIQKYRAALASGIAKEQARCFLPEGLTMSRMYVNGSLRSWIHYCQVRCDKNTTQKEHVDIANKIWAELLGQYPFLEAFDILNYNETIDNAINTNEVKTEYKPTAKGQQLINELSIFDKIKGRFNYK